MERYIYIYANKIHTNFSKDKKFPCVSVRIFIIFNMRAIGQQGENGARWNIRVMRVTTRSVSRAKVRPRSRYAWLVRL